MSDGNTKEEALQNVQDAIQAWIDAATETGVSVPEERFDVRQAGMTVEEFRKPL